MKKVIFAVLAVVMMAGTAAAADHTSGVAGATTCTWTVHKVWPVAAFLTIGAWTGPESVNVEFSAALPAAEAAGEFSKEAKAELVKEKGAGNYTGQIVCQDASTTARVTVE